MDEERRADKEPHLSSSQLPSSGATDNNTVNDLCNCTPDDDVDNNNDCDSSTDNDILMFRWTMTMQSSNRQ